MVQFLKKRELCIHKTSSRNSALSIPIKFISNHHYHHHLIKFFSGSSVKSIIYLKMQLVYNDMSDLFLFSFFW